MAMNIKLGDFLSHPKLKKMTLFLNVVDFGAVGDGQADDTAALQAAINDACPQFPLACKTLLAPSDAVFKVSASLTVQQCWYARLDFQNAQIVWAGQAGGTVLFVNQVNNSDFRNIKITLGSANIGIDIVQQPPVQFPTTGNHFENITIQNHAANPQFVGIRLGAQSVGNCDRQTFDRITIFAADTLPTVDSNGDGFQIAENSQAEPLWTEIRNINTTYCSNGIHICNGVGDNVGLFRVLGGLANRNHTDFWAENGQGLYYGWIRSEGAITQIVFGNGGANPDDAELDHLEFAGLTPGTTTIVNARSNSSMMLRAHDLTWDQNVEVIPIGGQSNGVLFTQNNRWPASGSPKPNWQEWGGWVHEGTPTGSNTFADGGLYTSKLATGEP